MKKVKVEMSPEQAKVVCDALDFYNRILIGQFEELEHILRYRMVCRHGDNAEKLYPSFDELDIIKEHLQEVKMLMGFPRNGSFGIGHPNVHISASRSYEIMKTIQKVLAEDRNPNPEFRTVDYDGVIVRYTVDELPTCNIEETEIEENNDGC